MEKVEYVRTDVTSGVSRHWFRQSEKSFYLEQANRFLAWVDDERLREEIDRGVELERELNRIGLRVGL